MKHISSTLLLCLFALSASGQQVQTQNTPAESVGGSAHDAAVKRDSSPKRFFPAVAEKAAAHVAPRTTQSIYQGTWSSAVTYAQSQSVLFSGAIYYSLLNNNVANNPANSPSAWSYLAPGGTQSPCGAATIYGPCVLTVNDLPTIPTSQVSGLASVATSGSYRDLTNTPTLGTAASQNVSAFDPAGAAAAITLSGLGGVTPAQAAAAAPVQTVAGRTGAVSLTANDIAGLGSAASQNVSAFDPAGAAAAITLAGLGGVTAAQATAAAPVQTVAGRTGAINLTASDIAGLGSAATQSASAFDPAGAAAAITLSGLGGITAPQAAAAAPVQKVAGRTGTINLTTSDIAGLGSAATQSVSAFDPAGAAAAITLSGLGGVTAAQATAVAPVQTVAGRTGAITLSSTDIGGLGSAATQNANIFSIQGGYVSNTFCVGTGGVTANHLIKWDTNGCAVAATAGAFKGIALSTAASGGSVEVARVGIVACNFTTATTINNLAIQSTTDPTSCADSGQTSEGSIANTTLIVGGIHATVPANTVGNVRWHGIDVAGTQQAFSTIAGQPTDNANLSTVLGKKQSSIVLNVLDYGLVADGATDNTAAWNALMASSAVTNGGAAIFFPCNGSTNIYKFSGQMVFKPNASYYTDAGNNGFGGCKITSQYSGTDAAFLFVGADHIQIKNLYLSSNNSTSPPYTVATFGWCYPTQNYAVYGSATGPSTACNGAGKGSHIHLENMKFGGYATKAIVYGLGSEEWTAIDTYMYNMGGGAPYTYYTSQYDDLNACSECTFNSNTDNHFFGSHFVDQTNTGTNTIVGLGRGNTGDISFVDGYFTFPIGGLGGNCVGMAYPNATPITVSNTRCENATTFFNVPASTNVNGFNLMGNSLASSVSKNFITIASGGTITGLNTFGNSSITAPSINIAAGLVNSNVNEPSMLFYGPSSAITAVASNGVNCQYTVASTGAMAVGAKVTVAGVQSQCNVTNGSILTVDSGTTFTVAQTFGGSYSGSGGTVYFTGSYPTITNSSIRTSQGFVKHGAANLVSDGLTLSCNTGTRGTVYIDTTGTPDVGKVCERTSSGQYQWVYFGSIAGTTASWNNGGSAIAANSCVNGPAVTVYGANTGAALAVAPAATPGLGLDWNNAYVSSTNTVQVVICNKTAAALTPTATTYNVRVIE